MTTNYHEATVENDGTIVVSEIEPDEVLASEAYGMLEPRFQRALASWAEDTHKTDRRTGGLFQRDKYVTPGSVLGQMALAYDSADDDIISGILETSESIAFQKIQFESKDPDQEDVWNQIAADLNLDNYIRMCHRELMIASQFYGVRWWGKKTFRVRGEKEGRKRRKEYELTVPTHLGLLDPLRVVPVGADMFGNSQLAWIGSDSDTKLIVTDERPPDELMEALFVGKFTPSKSEAAKLEKEDIPTDRLLLLNDAYVFRHTLTKSPFERWANLRMKSLFPLLDLKHQVREMDRAWLLGGINFLVLVTRGSDDRPATRTEVQDTAGQMRTQSRSPIIVTDHRISIEIITPDIEHVLDSEKWAVLDERIMMRMWGTLMLSSEMGGRETSVTLGKVVARGLSSRRHMLKRSIERDVVKAVQNHPDNLDSGFEDKTRLEYIPRHIELEFDAAIANVINELRDRGDISRGTILGELGFDQDLEAERREREDRLYEDVFKPVNVPFDSPNKTTPGGSGRKGGRKPGVKDENQSDPKE